MVIVRSKEDAWRKADELFPTDYMKDDVSSENAGYDIYKSTLKGMNAWISDLGNSLELNLADGRTIRIVVLCPEFNEYQIADALGVISEAIYQIDDKVDIKLADKIGISEAREKLYSAYSLIADILKKDYPNSKLYDRYNLNDID